MIRSLDFTVEAGNTYRYRVRVVAPNLEAGRLGNPKQPDGPTVSVVDGRIVRKAVRGRNPKELSGPWSGPTAEVAVQ